MANLNFQQPPRSLANASLNSRSVGVFGSSSLSGHVTPTSGMYSQVNSGFGLTSQSQLSPNRNIQLSTNSNNGNGSLSGSSIAQISSNGRTNLFTQRSFADRRTMHGGLGPMSSMGSFMQTRGYGAQSGNNLNNFHSVFGTNAGDSSTPQLLDLSEFPSLTTVRGNESLPHTNPLQPPGSKPYVGMVKQPTSEHSEFQMSNEDFPALPGTQITDGSCSSMVIDGQDVEKVLGNAAGVGVDLQTDSICINDKAFKRGIQTSPDGKVTNIPSSMVNNQFGMVGLLTFIRAAESDPNLVTLAMGQDLTGLGLNLNSQENLYPTFGGPFADQPCRPQDIDFHVPPEYMINMAIRDKLANLNLEKYKDDLLFFLFYTNVGDFMQLAAAAELHNRDWRYHIEEKVWITRVPGGITHYEKNGTTERGTFYYFDAQNWRRVPKDFQIDAGKLDKCPKVR